ncbi:hypothetical protein BCR34DRAFT_485248 [Clohesyomyces aquaticus]|uniref:C2H2-type domain-containing protein n=1 Tax=Clohesyomyces aquaticus TaxID=1231657 RepID=A0A1Y1ZKF3_9PLEO|nr:hypothetical protein BCR34DRAFT_485248 [Clohesyomyces aquaticus]
MTDEEDGLPKRPKRDRANEPEERGDIRRRFACPYYQRNPGGYLTRRSCVGPGWEEVRRVKEHLYRTHTLPIFCPRCYATFKSDHLLHEHQRADERCPKQPEEFIEGFDKLQEKQLRSRKKIQPEPSEEDKWKEMYRVLFPDDDEALMPSPYMNYNWERVYQRRKPASDELARYEQFLRRELPPAVRRELESAVERQFSPLEESLKSQLIEIVRDLQLRLFESYTQARNAAGVASTDLPCATGASMEEKSSGTGASGVLPGTSSDHHSADPEITLEDQLAPFQPAPPTDNPTVDFDPILYQFTIEGIDDSGYSSMFDTFADSAYVNTVCDEEPGMYCVPEYDNGEGPSRRKG